MLMRRSEPATSGQGTVLHMGASATSALHRLSVKKQAVFLAALAECGHVGDAAKAAGLTPQRMYQMRASDPAFARAWDEAAELGADALEDEARRRAFHGVEKPLTCAKGLILDDLGQPVMVREYSDTLLIFLLKGARPQKYRDNVHMTAQNTTFGVTVVMERIQNDPRYAEYANTLARLLTGVVDDGGSAE